MNVHEYPTDEIVIQWGPEKCIHAGVCVKMLPEVYRPKEKPWILPNNGGTNEIINQIDKCPSRALTYRKKI